MGLEDCADREIWDYARKNGFSIVTFDADFYDLSNLKGHPPKIIWLRFGNTSTDAIAWELIDRYILIKYFVESAENDGLACLEIK